MRLSISNIAWSSEQDNKVYELMKKHGYSGLEIAPTRIFTESPYDKYIEAETWSKKFKEDYSFFISSMQSIWYGRQERIFGNQEERQFLICYTKKAVDLAAAIDCKNLVFGCPRNRNIPNGVVFQNAIATAFFREIGDYAFNKGTFIGMEANPPIYNTNYINDTKSALELIKEVDSKGFLLNLDVGTMIHNNEDAQELVGSVKRINHVHISEPGLKPIEERDLHKELRKVLDSEGYQGFISLEMGRVDDIQIINDKMQYIRSIFG